MIKEKKNIPLLLGMVLIFIGSLLPSIRIAQENISFTKENGIIMIILAVIMFLLLKLDKKQLIVVPSGISLGLIIKFIIDNTSRIKEINDIYKCYAGFQIGVPTIIIGNIIILLTLGLAIIKTDILKNILEKTKEFTLNRLSNIKTGTKVVIAKIKGIIENRKSKKKIAKIEKINKKENKQKVTTETSKDGKIKFNKIVVKVDNKPKEKQTLKEKISLFILKHKVKKISKKNISITKYKDEPAKKVYNIHVVDIKKWTRSSICCSNCGATVNTTSEYCFLCDSKIKLNDNEELYKNV